MLTAVFESLRKEYRTHRMARFAFFWVLAYGLALWLAGRVTGRAPGLLWFLFWVSVLSVGVYYLIRLGGVVRHRLLWRLRRRLIITYLFIAVVPIFLILLLVVLGAEVLNGQFAAFLVTAKLRNHFDELRQLNRVVAHEAHLTRAPTPEALLDDLQRFYLSELSEHAESYPGLEITLRGGSEERAFRLDGKPLVKPGTVPVWLTKEEFAGVVVDRNQIALRAVDRGQTPVGNLTVILSLPITPELLDLVGAGIGPVGVLVPQAESLPLDAQGPKPVPQFTVAMGGGKVQPAVAIRSKSVQIPAPAFRLDFTVFGGSTLEPIVWGGEKEEHLTEPVLLYATSRIVALSRQLLATLGKFSHIYVTLFLAVAAIFLVIELFALVIGVRLTRSMTSAVDTLHQATERVKAGDFSYRIGLSARDQLSALGVAFDGMTASIERLLRESQEKSRLESEIEIAREVQRQLFPQALPQVPGIQLYGVCKPARAVSGDYYDFLRLGVNQIGLALGDVSGKGISAALLMATIQSALRAQIYDGFSSPGLLSATPISTAEVVERLNRQLFESTPLEKYATFFYAVYDGATQKLTYTNAGHPPPILFRRGAIERLNAGGTAVGLFSPMTYEQSEIGLLPGDLLLAFTDGVTEPENSYGEEFGEARVLEIARRALSSPPEVLVDEISRGVADWTGTSELQDDMTLLVAKLVAIE